MKTSLIVFLAIVLNLNFIQPLPLSSEDEDDEKNIIDLSEINPKIFGVPDPKVGELLKNWTPESGVNPETLGSYFEGDLLIPTNARAAKVKETSIWPDGIVPYVINSTLNSKDVQQVKNCMDLFHANTCIKFVERSNEDDYVTIGYNAEGCFSTLGRTGGPQRVNLQSGGCTSKVGTVCHEFMHMLGFWHEHTRYDRDKYVKVVVGNIDKNMLSNFDKHNERDSTNYGVEYNYGSVMHYPANAFPKSKGLITIKALQKDGEKLMGQRDGFADTDLEQINIRYNCVDFLPPEE